ncbi:hypothetical protein JCM11491_002513 [Sporobolomyces phaffii]
MDPDSSLPSLFPYDSFPIPRGLSTPRAARVIVGAELLETLKRPRGLAPALPVSPPRSSSTASASSPSRSRQGNAAELRTLAQKNRKRDSFGASRSTLASFTSTGESVYEDAIEPDSDAADEVLLADYPELSHPTILPPLDASDFPDTPPELDVPAEPREPRNREITPRPNPPPPPSTTVAAAAVLLTPETVASVDERTLYQQRQAQLGAEATKQRRHGGDARRLSISSVPLSPRRGGVVPPSSFRRHSGVVPTTPGGAHDSHYRRLSLSSPPVTVAGQTTTTRPRWHPKPLVLTPARTLSTPLTGESPSNHGGGPASPPRHHLEGGGGYPYLRTHSRGSSYHHHDDDYYGTVRSVSPLSPPGRAGHGRATSPLFQSSPRRQQQSTVKRRSLGYVDSAALPSAIGHHRHTASFGGGPYDHVRAGRRGRSASEDTGTTRTTVDSLLTRFTTTTPEQGRGDDTSPESSLGGGSGSSDGRHPSPLLNDKEWEQQWHANGASGGGGTPLEMVAEVSSGDLEPPPPLLGAAAAAAVRARPLSIRRDSVPPTPPPRLPLPRTPSSSSRRPSSSSMSLPTKRTRQDDQKYDERWNGEPLVVEPDDSSSSSSGVGDEYSDVPVSPKKPALGSATSDLPTSPPRRPIVIKGTNNHSAAALARRSARLSLVDPPLYPASANSSRYSVYSSEHANAHAHGVVVDSRPSSRASRHTTTTTATTGRSSREPSQDLRFGGGGGAPLSTLPESPRFSPRLPYAAAAPAPERAPSRMSYASSSSPRISIGSTFAKGLIGATSRRVEFEPRDPRTREELDAGQGSYLEVLLYSEPPPRPTRPAAPSTTTTTRWSTTTTASSKATTAAAGPPVLIRSDTPPSSTASKVLLHPVPAPAPASSSSSTKAKTTNSTFAQKWFGGLRGKAPSPSSSSSTSTTKNDKAQAPPKRRPMSMMAQSPARAAAEPRPRPIVSGPLELQRAEQLERAQRARSSSTAATAGGGGGESSAPNGSGSLALKKKSYASLARVYERDGDDDDASDRDPTTSDPARARPLNRSASLETVDRPAPRPFSLPPGLLVNSPSSDSLRAPLPPVTPIKPPRSPLRPPAAPAPSSASAGGTELAAAARAGSPVSSSFKSFPPPPPPRSVGSYAAKSFVSTTTMSEPIGVRDVLRGQFLER